MDPFASTRITRIFQFRISRSAKLVLIWLATRGPNPCKVSERITWKQLEAACGIKRVTRRAVIEELAARGCFAYWAAFKGGAIYRLDLSQERGGLK